MKPKIGFNLRENNNSKVHEYKNVGFNLRELKSQPNNSIPSKSNCHEVFIYEPPENNTWLLDRGKLSRTLKEEKVIHFPIVIDTEFTNASKQVWGQTTRIHITTQIKGISQTAPKAIYVNPQVEKKLNYARLRKKLPPFVTVDRESHFIDYLEKECGFNVTVKPVGFKRELWGKNKFIVTMYAHFATAELNMVFSGSLKEKIKELQRSEGFERIEHARRTRCVTRYKDQELDYVELDHLIYINGIEYSLCLRIVDTGAIHGVASYADFCKASGWKLTHKDDLEKSEKKNMIETAIKKPKEFEDYSLGDLDVYEALESFHAKWKEIYNLLKIDDKYQVPKLTIGGTVKDLFVSSLADMLGISGKKWLETFREFTDDYLMGSSAGELRKDSKYSSALLAKVEGGRCRNNRPTDIFVARKVKGKYDSVLICDIDISGCYGEGQRNQLYLVGRPEILSFKVTNKNNKYPTLREWLESYDVDIDGIIKTVNANDLKSFQNQKIWGELVSGCWQLRMSTFKDLTYPQDFFASWFTNTGNGVKVMAKFVNQMKCDSEVLVTDDVDFDESEGNLKIFNHEIHNGVLTSDGLEWIFCIASKRQRNEMLDKIHVLSSMVYPNSSRIDTGSTQSDYQKLLEDNEMWKGNTYAERVINPTTGKKSWRIHDGECHAWYGVNLGDLIINELLINRKKAKVKDGKKSPLDLLFKLGVNTLYGDMVSKFFAIANTCVGNNITARARMLCWCMEKGLHGHQSITDGCAFELNGVLFGRRDKIDGECVNLHRKGSKLENKKIRRGNLSDAQELKGYWVEYQAWNKDKKEPESQYALGLIVNGVDVAPIIKDDNDNPGCQKAKEPAKNWIDCNAMIHLQNTFNLVSVLHRETTSIEVDDKLNVEFKPRMGQFSFETKDVYYEGGFHGSANYVLKNPNSETIKARGYEVKKSHISMSQSKGNFAATNRYGDKNSPAKDFMNQIVTNPSKIQRQEVAIKEGILKIGDYKNIPGKYDYMGIEPGDTIRRTLLMTECSLSQFTFQTYGQWKSWNDSHMKDKEKNKQSLEIYFMNGDDTLDLQLMSDEIDVAIADGVIKPNPYFDKNRNRGKKPIEHPQKANFDATKEKLKEEKSQPTEA